MENLRVKLTDVLSIVKETGHLGWLKILHTKKVFANSSGTLQLNPTIYMQNFVQKEYGDEIIIFGKKQLNVTKLEKDLSKYIGLEVNFFIGGKSFCGILEK